jgi:hypothetical protein
MTTTITRNESYTTRLPVNQIGAASYVNVSAVRPSGLHGLKLAGKTLQMIFATPEDAIAVAQRLVPMKGGDKIEVVPVSIVEKKEFRR